MKTLTVLLGAGFSFNAGLPMALSVSKRFETNYQNKLIRHASQWAWAEGKDEVEIHNGSLDGDVPTMPFIMNEIIAEYVRINGHITNYELFYSFLEEQKEDWFKPLVALAKDKFFKHYPDLPDTEIYSHNFDSFGKYRVIDLINYLIADMLHSKKEDEELSALYAQFITTIKQFDVANIFSLNHDLVLERIFASYKIEFCDGFSKRGSELIDAHAKEPILTFQNTFNTSGINLIKLHGTIDMVRYIKNDLIGGSPQYSGYLYFKPRTQDELHYPTRINVETGETIQTPPNTILPRFITGVNKAKKISSDYMYSSLLEKMQTDFTSSENVLIVGYSYADEHINDIIKQIPSKSIIRNINPSMSFPFTFKNVQNFNYLDTPGALEF